ncbi:MAG TPA: hypothetical protein PLB05_01295 [Candidatus Omnitrophota bacterium]|mgnify:CR=1 FL=1|jgi:hypothetical protein|nr:hypothetical protein [Candidatus Omnitrophota bacterium]
MSMNLEALNHYLESRFSGSPIVVQGDRMTVKYRNSEGLLFTIVAREEADGVSLRVTTPLMLLNPQTREKFEHFQDGLVDTLSKGLFEDLGVEVDHEAHVCAWAKLGTEPLCFPNKIVETFVEGALGLPVAFKKSLF